MRYISIACLTIVFASSYVQALLRPATSPQRSAFSSGLLPLSSKADVAEGLAEGITDEILSPLEMLRRDEHMQLLEGALKKKHFWGGKKEEALMYGHLWAKLKRVFDIRELGIFSILYFYHKFILRSLHKFSCWLQEKMGKDLEEGRTEARKYLASDPHAYEQSLFGHIEEPVKYGLWSFAALYSLDVLLIIVNFFKFPHRKDLPKLAFKVLSGFVLGSTFTRIKDYILHIGRYSMIMDKKLSTKKRKRDPIRDQVIDELSSVLIWMVMTVGIVEQLSLELGFAVGSFFAVGGIGSATVILALRSIFENLVGGLLLKVQDRFRQGEKISIGNNKEDGWVEEIGIVNTIIRRVDNSRVAVPNNDFVTDLVVNWSRTPFRIFNAHVFIPSEDADALQPIVQAIRRRVATVEGIASPDDRPLLVFASEFKRNEWHVDGKLDMSIQVDITCHMVTQIITKLAEVKTDIVEQIALGIEDGLAEVGKQGFSSSGNGGNIEVTIERETSP